MLMKKKIPLLSLILFFIGCNTDLEPEPEGLRIKTINYFEDHGNQSTWYDFKYFATFYYDDELRLERVVKSEQEDNTINYHYNYDNNEIKLVYVTEWDTTTTVASYNENGILEGIGTGTGLTKYAIGYSYKQAGDTLFITTWDGDSLSRPHEYYHIIKNGNKVITSEHDTKWTRVFDTNASPTYTLGIDLRSLGSEYLPTGIANKNNVVYESTVFGHSDYKYEYNSKGYPVYIEINSSNVFAGEYRTTYEISYY